MTMITANRVSHQEKAGGPTPEQARKGRRTAFLLFALGFGPMILATIMFYTGWMNPAGHTNQGALIAPTVPVAALNLETLSDEPLAKRFSAGQTDPQWLLVVAAGECDSRCEELLYLARQANVALGKNANRVSRAAVLGSITGDLAARWPTEYPLMERLVPAAGTTPAWPTGINPEKEPRIMLVDPFGNVMMHFGPGNTGKDILEDLKHLLKLSLVG
ncbi:hypothetical protein SAMN04488490_3078 [Marinobacter sp. LV10R510-11A]|uniref:hypothetical protein n=1 Tax=Marinobacter sp. LV10R510-11A TaxID=1415568 RepID=UPI000BC0A4F9|nr:hypothetical protein [Marinobacter sp. LV10R510-11A]SOB77280.1 hypothetical protein SAMN04488490_3078 [Marinobacter sp. LV10R510-11A]